MRKQEESKWRPNCARAPKLIYNVYADNIEKAKQILEQQKSTFLSFFFVSKKMWTFFSFLFSLEMQSIPSFSLSAPSSENQFGMIWLIRPWEETPNEQRRKFPF